MTEPAAPEDGPVNALLDDFLDYVGVKRDEQRNGAARRLAEAVAIVDKYVLDGGGVGLVPQVILESAYMEVGSKLWGRRRDQTGGGQQFGEAGAMAVPVPRDPLVTVYAQLRPYLGGPFG